MEHIAPANQIFIKYDLVDDSEMQFILHSILFLVLCLPQWVRSQVIVPRQYKPTWKSITETRELRVTQDEAQWQEWNRWNLPAAFRSKDLSGEYVSLNWFSARDTSLSLLPKGYILPNAHIFKQYGETLYSEGKSFWVFDSFLPSGPDSAIIVRCAAGKFQTERVSCASRHTLAVLQTKEEFLSESYGEYGKYRETYGELQTLQKSIITRIMSDSTSLMASEDFDGSLTGRVSFTREGVNFSGLNSLNLPLQLKNQERECSEMVNRWSLAKYPIAEFDGKKERLACDATFNIKIRKDGLQQEIVYATQQGKFREAYNKNHAGINCFDVAYPKQAYCVLETIELSVVIDDRVKESAKVVAFKNIHMPYNYNLLPILSLAGLGFKRANYISPFFHKDLLRNLNWACAGSFVITSLLSKFSYSKYTENPIQNSESYNRANFLHKVKVFSGFGWLGLVGIDISLTIKTMRETEFHNYCLSKK